MLRKGSRLALAALAGLSLTTGLLGGAAPAAQAGAPARQVAPAAIPASPTWVENFNAPDPSRWAGRSENILISNTRTCSLPVAENSVVAGGALRATVARANAAQKAHILAMQKSVKSKFRGCKYGVYTDASASTEGKFAISKYGKVETRVKFPLSQGLHTAVWLQSATGPEIDLIESFGYGKGVTNYVHVKSTKGKTTRYPKSTSAGYVLKSQTKKKSWWGKWHTFSVEWNAVTSGKNKGKTKYLFKADRKTTKTLYLSSVTANYFPVVSAITSDWELKYISKPSKGKAKGVKPATFPSTLYVDYIKAWQG